MSRGFFFSLLFFALASALLWWPEQKAAPNVGDSEAEPQSDYSATQISMRRFDSNGSLELRLDASRVAHFRAAALTMLDSPQLRHSASDGQQWQVQSLRGVLSGSDQLSLNEQVELTASGKNTQAPVRAETSSLQIDLASRQVHTDAPVVVYNGRATLNGVGLEADLGREHIVINDQVRAIYEPSP